MVKNGFKGDIKKKCKTRYGKNKNKIVHKNVSHNVNIKN